MDILDLCTAQGNWPDGHRRVTSIVGLRCAGDEVKHSGERFEFERKKYVRGRVSPEARRIAVVVGACVILSLAFAGPGIPRRFSCPGIRSTGGRS